jgi:hypothetical protein
MKRMRSNDIIAPIIRPTELSVKFLKSYMAGEPDYDAKL